VDRIAWSNEARNCAGGIAERARVKAVMGGVSDSVLVAVGGTGLRIPGGCRPLIRNDLARESEVMSLANPI
jgi:hypothetical protein